MMAAKIKTKSVNLEMTQYFIINNLHYLAIYKSFQSRFLVLIVLIEQVRNTEMVQTCWRSQTLESRNE